MRHSFILLLLGLTLAACPREERRLREEPSGQLEGALRQTELQPGPPRRDRTVVNPYDGNAYAISEGKRLYESFNCSGCHAHGGGDIGPPLMDARWIYGSDPENVFATIVEGRPNGMPAYRGKITEPQVWQLVAYVRSMVRLVPKAAASGRSDHMAARPSEQSRQREEPKSQEAERPQG